jgi:hypothetical protein
VEWALLHLIETLKPISDLQLIVGNTEDCELKNLISQRLENS